MDDKAQRLKEMVKSYPDFPKPGIVYRDVFSLLGRPEAFELLNELLLDHLKTRCKGNLTCVVGLESRGFLFGPILALNLRLPFVPVRKKGKLPGKLVAVDYQLEYGQDTFEVQSNALPQGGRALLVDDLLATGGSLKAAVELLRRCGTSVAECLVVFELTGLNGRKALDAPVHSLIQF